MKKMETILPPYSSCQLCSNSMNDICLERCAPAGDYQDFKLKEIALENAPRFPLKEFMEQMPPKVRQVVVGAYISLLVDYSQGRESHGHTIFRPHVNRSGSRPILEDFPVAALLADSEKEDSVHQAIGTPDRDPGERSQAVAGNQACTGNLKERRD